MSLTSILPAAPGVKVILPSATVAVYDVVTEYFSAITSFHVLLSAP